MKQEEINPNEERFIYNLDNDKYKKFSESMPLEAFEKEFAKGKRSDFLVKLPDYQPRKKYLRTLIEYQGYLQKDIDKAKKDACDLIDVEYREKKEFYELQIRKLRYIIFLEEECNIQCLPKQDSSEESSTS